MTTKSITVQSGQSLTIGFVAKFDLPAPACCPAMVYRQYRISPCVSSESAYPELPAPGMPRIDTEAARCSNPVFRDGLRVVRFVLWDEDRGRMITFHEADSTVAGSRA